MKNKKNIFLHTSTIAIACARRAVSSYERKGRQAKIHGDLGRSNELIRAYSPPSIFFLLVPIFRSSSEPGVPQCIRLRTCGIILVVFVRYLKDKYITGAKRVVANLRRCRYKFEFFSVDDIAWKNDGLESLRLSLWIEHGGMVRKERISRTIFGVDQRPSCIWVR